MRAAYRIIALAATVTLAFAWGAIVAPQAPSAVANLNLMQVSAQPKRIQLQRVTYYHAVPEQTDDDPLTSACGPNRPNQIAVSRDLFRTKLPCGTRVRLDLDGVGYAGEFIVWDTMAARWTASADILVPTAHNPSWGRTTGVLTVLGRP